MYKPLLIPLLCILLSGGCHERGHSPAAHNSDTLTAEVIPKDVLTDLDTAMISLRATRSVALIDVLGQVWKVDDADRPHWNELFWDSSENVRRYPELALFKDFSLTENARYNIKMGDWQLSKEKKELQIHFSDGTRKTYSVRQIALKQMMLDCDRGLDRVSLTLSADALVHKQPMEDPFHPANNQWRIKPRAPETEEQVRTRLKGYVHFYSLFFHDNRLRQSKDISFSGLPACLVWYNGGIGMPEKKELDDRWVGCFYSEEQAMKGYEILAAILEKHDLKWPEHPTSWIKQIYEVLDQIYDKL